MELLIVSVKVNNKKELARAIKEKKKNIVICDPDLAEKVRKFKRVPKLSKSSLLDSSLTGVEVVAVVAITVLGVVVLFALYKDYDVEIEDEDDDGKGKKKKRKLILKRNK